MALREWESLHFEPTYASHRKLRDAFYELHSNALDATADGAPPPPPPKVVYEAGTLTITNWGKSLEPDGLNFGDAQTHSATSNGQHGVGLKDAIATLMRLGKCLIIKSGFAMYEFQVRPPSPPSKFKIPTVHVRMSAAETSEKFTEIAVSGVTDDEFLAFKHELARSFLSHAVGLGGPFVFPSTTGIEVDLYLNQKREPNKGGTLYINGVRKSIGNEVKLAVTYNIRGPAAELFTSDQIVKDKVTVGKLLTSAVCEAMHDSERARKIRDYALRISRHLGPSKRVYEFMLEPSVLPEQTRAPVTAPPAPATAPPAPVTAPPPASRSRLIVLLDWENAQNAAKVICDLTPSVVDFEAFIFCGHGKEDVVARFGVPAILERVQLVFAPAPGREAADTTMTFYAARLAVSAPVGTRFLIVAGSECRYTTLAALLVSEEFAAEYHQYNTDSSVQAASDASLRTKITTHRITR